MNNPTVCAILLTANRPDMAKQAVEAFRAQTYARKRLLILDTGTQSWFDSRSEAENEYLLTGAQHAGKSIGELRNIANECAHADVLCHWDDDDYSAPHRIAEQVALLQASGASAVGYNSMLFWREPRMVCSWREHDIPGEAWLYTGGIVGTSLMYWRRTCERRHFEPMNNGEDTRFLMGMKTVAESSLLGVWGYAHAANAAMLRGEPAANPFDDSPRMVARIHGGNTSNAYNPEVMRAVERQGGEWRRVQEWDDYCRGVFA